MLTKLLLRNFKRFDDVEIELGKSVVFIGPNNSGKTTALQALALWEIGLRRWNEKRMGKTSPEKRPGVTINRRDLISLPIPDAHLLWRDLHVRNVIRTKDSRQTTQSVCIDILVEGVTAGAPWVCGLEFDFANDESFYCRPLRKDPGGTTRMPIPEDAGQVRVAFLPPMSGLAAVEPKWEQGRINVLTGEGQTAQVLRNLCYRIFTGEQNDQPPAGDAVFGSDAPQNWNSLCSHIDRLFGVQLLSPEYLVERGEITMSYRERGKTFDLSSSGRGLQQTLLLLAYLYANPNTVLLLDEPDAHLEIIRQRQIYSLLTDIAEQQGSQVIVASHSEVILNEAADRDIVVAFLGRPHRIDDRGSQLLKSLKELGFEQYYQAEQKGWVLYLEGSTDLEILRSLADKLNHPAKKELEDPFVCYIGGNQPAKARNHFNGLREAKGDLLGIALFDRLDRELGTGTSLTEMMWKRHSCPN
ncbi:MAG TPA: AAA family ATPase [Candidatus Hydrogenedentes bacterium]|nr:AAA family ATPase [Candidatus Hydrogenedentota bacterium]HRT21440.1 AAA family ATPase [Candidatus Hydrogenedentota bacterium]HRT63956.1 AAA family ATPase [Candidatus Hydrogenedentota bacterium]